MNNLIHQIFECVENGKINLTSPYPPQLKGQPGADELTRQALDEGVTSGGRIHHGYCDEWYCDNRACCRLAFKWISLQQKI